MVSQIRTTLLSAAALLTLTSATAVDYTNWAAPGTNEVRSPCPALNALANHGILPRSGKNYTLPLLIEALEAGLNVGPDFTAVIGGTGMLSSSTPGSFDLDDLSKHNFPIEHDASLSRADYYTNNGDSSAFNETIWETVLGYFHGLDETTIEAAAKARYHRVQTEAQQDERFTYTAQQWFLSYGETALYLSVMGDPITGAAPVDWVRIFFEEERLPYAEGWRRPTLQTNAVTLAAMIVELNAATGEEVPEGLVIADSTLAQAFSGLDPVTGLVAETLAGDKSGITELLESL